MMGRLFWFVAAVFFGVATHLAYVLFTPLILFQKQFVTITNDKPVNKFFILDPTKKNLLIPTSTAQAVVGICSFDLNLGPIVVSAKLPKSFWTVSIYTQSGQQVYSLNDIQAGSNDFTIELSRAKSIFQQLFGNSSPEDAVPIDSLGWHAESNEQFGFVVMWVPLADELMRDTIEATVKDSRCQPK